MEDFNIRNITLTELPQLEEQIKETANRAFKCPGYDEDIVADLKTKTDPVIKICMNFNGQIIGFGYGYIAQADTLASFLKVEADNIPDPLLAADKQGRIGIIKTIVTDPTCQGRGIGTKLVREIEQGLLQNDATEIIVPAWKAGNRINIKKIMERTGHKPNFTVDGFWKEDCDSGEFQCVDRINKCICSAVFYAKTL